MVNVTSNSGTYDMKTEMLTLIDNVHLVSSTGYEARLSEAMIDVHKGNVHVGEAGLGEAHQRRDQRQAARSASTAATSSVSSGGVSMTVQPEQDTSQASNR